VKVLGKTKDGYICEVSHTELEKVFDKYYGNLPKLETGANVELGDGHNFRGDIKSACASMVNAMKDFDRARTTLLRFSEMVSKIDEQGDSDECF